MAAPAAPSALAQTGVRGAPRLEKKAPPGVDAADPLLETGRLDVTRAGKRPMVDVVNSGRILISHAKSFRTGDFPQVRETRGEAVIEVPSDRASALLVRE